MKYRYWRSNCSSTWFISAHYMRLHSMLVYTQSHSKCHLLSSLHLLWLTDEAPYQHTHTSMFHTQHFAVSGSPGQVHAKHTGPRLIQTNAFGLIWPKDVLPIFITFPFMFFGKVSPRNPCVQSRKHSLICLCEVRSCKICESLLECGDNGLSVSDHRGQVICYSGQKCAHRGFLLKSYFQSCPSDLFVFIWR